METAKCWGKKKNNSVMEEEVDKKITLEDSTLNSTFLHFLLLFLFLLPTTMMKKTKTMTTLTKRKRKEKNWGRFDVFVGWEKKEKKWMKGKRRRKEEEDRSEGEEKDGKYDPISVLKQEDSFFVCQKLWEESWCMTALRIFPLFLSVFALIHDGRNRMNEWMMNDG